MPLTASLWIGGMLQAASNLVFCWLAFVGLNHWALTAAIVAELEVHSALETDCFYLALASVMKDGNRLRAAFDEHIGILELARALRE